MRAPGQGTPPVAADLIDQIDAWLGHPALHTLLERFGAPPPTAGLDVVADWTSANWNFRAGRERNFLDPGALAPETDTLAVRLAAELGLVTPERPSLPEYDHLLILGGLIGGCVWRAEYAKHLLETGTRAQHVTAITGRRLLYDNETALLTVFGLPALLDESEVLREVVNRSFGPDGLTVVARSPGETVPNAQWSVEEGLVPGGPPISVVMAPSSEPATRRANTPDSYRFWAEEVAELSADDRILLVTSQTYVPFQHADAVRMLGLPYGCSVETVGIDRSVVNGRGIAGNARGVTYLQEINSALRSFRMLRDALARQDRP